MTDGVAAGSFRDPGGFVFRRDGIVYRQINPMAGEDYDLLMSSGLCDELVKAGLLVPHLEVGAEAAHSGTAHQVIQPEPIPFFSYPYEWCFSQLQDGALATLEILRRAVAKGMILKDASAYNLQLRHGRMTLIDTLSFRPYRDGEAWVGYRQFCQHFLAPLAWMSHVDVRLGQSLRVHIDGIPLDLASALLPLRTRLRFGLLTHIHLHARSQRHFAGSATAPPKERKVGKNALLGLIDNLEGTVKSLRWRPLGTEWAEYTSETHYSDAARDEKSRLVTEMLDRDPPASVWDIGANTGVFSRLASSRHIPTVSFDGDPAAVERNYLRCRDERDPNLLPLLLDLTNPSPGLGWAHRERDSWIARGPVDTAMALALIHHLAISNNVPLPVLSTFFAELCQNLIIEFVPKDDDKVRTLLASREDIFPNYHEQGFEDAFQRDFTIETKSKITDNKRTLYFMKKRA